MPLDDLLTQPELLVALGKVTGDLEPGEADQLGFSMKAASQAIRTHTGRSFEKATGVATNRTFHYDGTGFLDIDDATSVISVNAQWGSIQRTLLGDEWLAQPYGGFPVFEWVEVGHGVLGVGSPEMGFERNLDKLYPSGLPGRPLLMEVVADWGWTEIPYDVRQAAVWIASALVEDPSLNVYQSESIEGYSRSRGPETPNQIIPDRAMAALAAYEKLKV